MPRPNVPQLDDAARQAALKKAAETRHARAVLCQEIKAGRKSVIDALNSDDPLVTRMRVKALIRAVPGYGKIRATNLMNEIGIHENRRVGGLGVRQREALIEVFSA